jgi:hypothetical protein
MGVKSDVGDFSNPFSVFFYFQRICPNHVWDGPTPLLPTEEAPMNPYDHVVTLFISEVVKIKYHLHTDDFASNFTSLESSTWWSEYS